MNTLPNPNTLLEVSFDPEQTRTALVLKSGLGNGKHAGAVPLTKGGTFTLGICAERSTAGDFAAGSLSAWVIAIPTRQTSGLLFEPVPGEPAEPVMSLTFPNSAQNNPPQWTSAALNIEDEVDDETWKIRVAVSITHKILGQKQYWLDPEAEVGTGGK